MNEQQRRTVKRLGVAAVAVVALIGWLLYTEFAAVGQGGNSTISEVTWMAWASQPGAILPIIVAVVALLAYLAGHLFWQNSGKYQEIREPKRERSAVAEAMRDLGGKAGLLLVAALIVGCGKVNVGDLCQVAPELCLPPTTTTTTTQPPAPIPTPTPTPTPQPGPKLGCFPPILTDDQWEYLPAEAKLVDAVNLAIDIVTAKNPAKINGDGFLLDAGGESRLAQDNRQWFHDEAAAELRAAGFCAGLTGADQIEVATSCDGPWEGYHIIHHGTGRIIRALGGPMCAYEPFGAIPKCIGAYRGNIRAKSSGQCMRQEVEPTPKPDPRPTPKPELPPDARIACPLPWGAGRSVSVVIENIPPHGPWDSQLASLETKWCSGEDRDQTGRVVALSIWPHDCGTKCCRISGHEKELGVACQAALFGQPRWSVLEGEVRLVEQANPFNIKVAAGEGVIQVCGTTPDAEGALPCARALVRAQRGPVLGAPEVK